MDAEARIAADAVMNAVIRVAGAQASSDMQVCFLRQTCLHVSLTPSTPAGYSSRPRCQVYSGLRRFNFAIPRVNSGLFCVFYPA